MRMATLKPAQRSPDRNISAQRALAANHIKLVKRQYRQIRCKILPTSFARQAPTINPSRPTLPHCQILSRTLHRQADLVIDLALERPTVIRVPKLVIRRP